jgi:hypothetical protein
VEALARFAPRGAEVLARFAQRGAEALARFAQSVRPVMARLENGPACLVRPPRQRRRPQLLLTQ